MVVMVDGGNSLEDAWCGELVGCPTGRHDDDDDDDDDDDGDDDDDVDGDCDGEGNDDDGGHDDGAWFVGCPAR